MPGCELAGQTVMIIELKYACETEIRM